jgi:hypothetical protein
MPPLKSLLALSLVLTASATAPAQSYFSAEQVVWKLERAFCDDTRSGNLTAAMDLVDPDFLGWGGRAGVPMHKDDLAESLAQTAAERSASKTHSVSFLITPVTSHPVGNMVILEYTVTDILTDTAHHTIETHNRVTHTWIQRGDSWKMLGGMSTVASQVTFEHK